MKAARRAGVVLLLHYLSYTLRHAPRGVGAGHSRPDPSRRCLKTQILNQRPGWRTLPRANQWTASRRRKKRRAADAHLATVSKSGPGNGDCASWRAAGAARRCRPNTRTSFRAPVRRGRARRRNRKALRLIQVSLLREVSDPGDTKGASAGRSSEEGGDLRLSSSDLVRREQRSSQFRHESTEPLRHVTDYGHTPFRCVLTETRLFPQSCRRATQAPDRTDAAPFPTPKAGA